MGNAGKIRQIVMLRQMLRRWRTRARGSSSSSSPPPPSSSAAAPLPPPPPLDVPEGHVAICVGNRRRRFVVRAAHLNHPAFHNLLQQAAEEYGFSHPGPLSLPCDEALFFQILRQISSSYTRGSSSAGDLDFPSGGCCCCRRSGGKTLWRADSIPLLRGYAAKQVW
ncbi:hypothetical protein HPP92_020266 [Vanilla planifolia]|uniref:Uncharacterized protein n=1 Tax=Vanilla planifolia TaxID=51239 RepID=A0A835Q050_VANPL|nr:hypothetical protein HPP92_020671 [Vanilla planifolia]KAG0461790.1 hypothetical protein HPP92_020266 [Vanilla planifolia]